MRTVAMHAGSIHCDHSDLMAIKQTGVSIIVASNAQEVHDLGILAHLVSIYSSHPVVCAFDGYKTSHTVQNVDFVDYSKLMEVLPV